MDIQLYIESGAIESYVLGLATKNEVAELEAFRFQYTMVESAINEFSKELETEIMSASVTPPMHIKAVFLDAIRNEEKPSLIYAPHIALQTEPQQTFGRGLNIAGFGAWKMLAAASVVLFVASAALNLYFYSRYAEKNKAYQALLTEKNSLFSANQIFQTNQHEWENTAKMMADPAMLMIKMKSAPKKNNMDATVFWDSRNKDVYIMAKELPKPNAGKQFQLWAIVDGKPVDAGMISPGCAGVCKMKNILRAQAFAITLENSGGSPTPHLEQLFVIGNINT